MWWCIISMLKWYLGDLATHSPPPTLPNPSPCTCVRCHVRGYVPEPRYHCIGQRQSCKPHTSDPSGAAGYCFHHSLTDLPALRWHLCFLAILWGSDPHLMRPLSEGVWRVHWRAYIRRRDAYRVKVHRAIYRAKTGIIQALFGAQFVGSLIQTSDAEN